MSNTAPVTTQAGGGAPTLVMARDWEVPGYLKHSSFYNRFAVGSSAALPSSSTSSSIIAGPSSSTALGSRTAVSTSASTGKTRRDSQENNEQQQIPLPSRLDSKHCCKRLLLTGDRDVRFMPERDEDGRERINTRDSDKDAAAVRADAFIPPQTGIYYFEMYIISKGLKGYIGIGFSTRSVDLERLPGWNNESYGYHGDDGKAFSCSGTGMNYGPKFGKDDTVGCGIDFVKKKAFFTKNGNWLGWVFDLSSDSGSSGLQARGVKSTSAGSGDVLKFYPTIGLQTAGEQVRVNFGQEKFRFDIDGFVKRRKQEVIHGALATSIPRSLAHNLSTSSSFTTITNTQSNLSSSSLSSLPIDASLLSQSLQAIIASYLSHEGYSSTSRAFRSQRRAEQEARNEAIRATSAFSSSAAGAYSSTSSGTATASTGTTTAGTVTPSSATGKKAKKNGSGNSSISKKVLKSALRSTLAREATAQGAEISGGTAGGDGKEDDGEGEETMGDESIVSQGDTSIDVDESMGISTSESVSTPMKPNVRDDFLLSDAQPVSSSNNEDTLGSVLAQEEKEEQDSIHRQSIRACIRDGKIDEAIAHLEISYPNVLDPNLEVRTGIDDVIPRDEESLLFRLKARKFVEMVLASGVSSEGDGDADGDGDGDDDGNDDDDDMKVDDGSDEAMTEMDDEDSQVASELIARGKSAKADSKGKSRMLSNISSSSSAFSSASASALTLTSPGSAPSLDAILDYGSQLQAQYPHSSSLSTIFSLLAYSTPSSIPCQNLELLYIVSQRARNDLADSINSAVLKSLGRRERPVLEEIVRQAKTTLDTLAELGEARAVWVGLDAE